jgi:hypothetical protein
MYYIANWAKAKTYQALYIHKRTLKREFCQRRMWLKTEETFSHYEKDDSRISVTRSMLGTDKVTVRGISIARLGIGICWW